MRFYGILGYVSEEIETKPGTYAPGIVEKCVRGDMIRDYRTADNAENQNVRLSNKISFIADPYAKEHYDSIRYVKLNGGGTKWTVTSAEINYPRLILTLGGIYNG